MKNDSEMSGQGIQSLELGIEILKKIADSDSPLSITEISNLCDISKSKLHRYLTSFCRTGFLKRDSSLQYSIGTDLVSIGLKIAESFNIKELAQPTLQKLRDSLNETVFLSIWRKNGPYPIVILESNRSINIGIKVGAQTSILTTAGRLFAAYMPENTTKEIIEKELKDHGLNLEGFREEISLIRRNGYSVTQEPLVPGIVAVGCPVFGRGNHIIATISIVGILGVLDLSADSEVISLLKQECRKLSESLQV